MRVIITAILCIIISAAIANAQWTSHLSLTSSTMSASTDEGPVAGNALGFFLKANDGTLAEFTKINHLSDINITALYGEGQEVYVGYANGNIDIVNVREYTTINIPELKNHSGIESKAINHFYKKGDKVYCSTKCGLIVLNRSKKEISARYIIDNNTRPNINASTILNDSIFVATSTGLYRAHSKSNMLENNKEWTRCTTTNISDIVSFDNMILMARGSKGNENLILAYNKGTEQPVDTIKYFRNLSVYNSYVLMAGQREMALHNYETIESTEHQAVVNYNSLYTDGEYQVLNVANATLTQNNIIIGDMSQGMVPMQFNGVGYHIKPNTPWDTNTFEIVATDDAVYYTGGGVSASWGNLNLTMEVHTYKNGKWEIASAGGRDALRIAIDPLHKDSIFISSWGSGIYQLKDGNLFKRYHYQNSSLVDYFNNGNYTWIGALTFDRKGYLYAGNALVFPGIAVRSPNNEWSSLDYPLIYRSECTKIVFSNNDNGWIVMPHEANYGICVFNTNGTPEDATDDMYRGAATYNDPRDKGVIKLIDQDGEVFADNPIDIAIDKDNILWIGTEKGLLTFKDDDKVFDIDKPVFHQIKVPRNDGTNYADYLLDGVYITCITVDGANRKWIGTKTDGVYLVSRDGMQTIHHFTADNSPLPSNEIKSIAVSPSNGEVFIATYYGIVSFRGDATEPADKMDEVKISPNPVRPAYNGSVTMDGFKDGTYVKVTDVNGRLLYSTRSTGGRATWNCRNLDGNKASTGVYIVWAVSEDGKEKCVGRIAVVK